MSGRVTRSSQRLDIPLLKGTLSRGFLRFGVKNVLTFKLNTFSRTQNTPRTSREEICSKGEQTILSVSGDFAKKLREKT